MISQKKLLRRIRNLLKRKVKPKFEIAFVIAGPPQSKLRDRLSTMRRGKKVIPISRKHENNIQLEKEIRNCFYEVMEYLPAKIHRYLAQPWKGPVTMAIVALMKKPIRGKYEDPITKPDWDNLGKLISDGLNRFAYSDDAQVVDGRAIKCYSKNPKTFVRLRFYEETKKEQEKMSRVRVYNEPAKCIVQLEANLFKQLTAEAASYGQSVSRYASMVLTSCLEGNPNAKAISKACEPNVKQITEGAHGQFTQIASEKAKPKSLAARLVGVYAGIVSKDWTPPKAKRNGKAKKVKAEDMKPAKKSKKVKKSKEVEEAPKKSKKVKKSKVEKAAKPDKKTKKKKKSKK